MHGVTLKPLWKVYGLLFLAGVGGSIGRPTPASAMSLAETVHKAIRSNPDILAADKNRQAMQQKLRQSQAGYFPTLELSAGIGRELTNTPASRRTGEDTIALRRREVEVNLNQMLFDGFKVKNDVEHAKAQFKAAEWGYHNTAESVAIEAVSVYLEVRKQRELLTLTGKYSLLQKEVLDKVQQWYEGGAGTIAEVWQTESRLALTASDITVDRGNLQYQESRFLRVVGEPPDALSGPVMDRLPLPVSLDQAIAEAERNHPYLQESRQTIEAARAMDRSARSEFWPRLDLVMSATHSDNIGGVEGDRRNASAIFQLKYNLFQGGATLARGREAIQWVQHAEEQMEKSRRSVREAVANAWHALQETNERIRYLTRHVEISQQVSSAYYEQFFADQRSLIDVLNAERELFGARSALLSGEYDRLLGEYRLLGSMGKLQETLKLLEASGSSTPSPAPSNNGPAAGEPDQSPRANMLPAAGPKRRLLRENGPEAIEQALDRHSEPSVTISTPSGGEATPGIDPHRETDLTADVAEFDFFPFPEASAAGPEPMMVAETAVQAAAEPGVIPAMAAEPAPLSRPLARLTVDAGGQAAGDLPPPPPTRRPPPDRLAVALEAPVRNDWVVVSADDVDWGEGDATRSQPDPALTSRPSLTVVEAESPPAANPDRIEENKGEPEEAASTRTETGREDLADAPRPPLTEIDATYPVASIPVRIEPETPEASSASPLFAVIVKPRVLNLRAAPSQQDAVVKKLDRGTPLQVLRARDGWLEVDGPDGARGWVASWAVTEIPADGPSAAARRI